MHVANTFCDHEELAMVVCGQTVDFPDLLRRKCILTHKVGGVTVSGALYFDDKGRNGSHSAHQQQAQRHRQHAQMHDNELMKSTMNSSTLILTVLLRGARKVVVLLGPNADMQMVQGLYGQKQVLQ